MPILPNARLVAQLQRRSRGHFYGDRALLLVDTATGAVDAYNNPVVTTTETPIECSFNDTALVGSYEQWKGFGDVGQIAGEIRFAGPEPTKGNRVRIVSRFGGLPNPTADYEIVMISARGALGYVCALKAVSL